MTANKYSYFDLKIKFPKSRHDKASENVQVR